MDKFLGTGGAHHPGFQSRSESNDTLKAISRERRFANTSPASEAQIAHPDGAKAPLDGGVPRCAGPAGSVVNPCVNDCLRCGWPMRPSVAGAQTTSPTSRRVKNPF